MKRLTREQVLKETKAHDPDSVKELSLGQRALSDVSCLSEFKNLERLDLRFNNLTSLEGLKSCGNLKWLSVVQNKLQSLKGIEGLSQLTVLNAGKNKLKSMEEVKSLVSLRALILNDNEISSICRLDQLKDLNTLVLSRNPISEIGESLAKVKNLSKISLSNCRFEGIGSSLKSCTELKELRLAHNEIKALPAELAFNKKLQNLDMGNNMITKWVDLKVLDSLSNLRNLNLQGNPIAENEKLAKKIRKLLPALHVFNAKPIDKSMNNEKMERAVDPSVNATDKSDDKGRKRSKHQTVSQNEDDNNITDSGDGIDTEKEKKRKRKKRDERPSEKEPVVNEDGGADKKKKKVKSDEQKLGELDVIDDGDTSFTELLAAGASENPVKDSEKMRVERAVVEKNLASGTVTNKKKKSNKTTGSMLELSQEAEIGIGGPSTWGD